MTSNYCADSFSVSDDDGVLWTAVDDDSEPEVCLGDLASGGGLEYGTGDDDAEELVDATTYTYAAGLNIDIDIPSNWSGSFTYACTPVLGDE